MVTILTPRGGASGTFLVSSLHVLWGASGPWRPHLSPMRHVPKVNNISPWGWCLACLGPVSILFVGIGGETYLLLLKMQICRWSIRVGWREQCQFLGTWTWLQLPSGTPTLWSWSVGREGQEVSVTCLFYPWDYVVESTFLGFCCCCFSFLILKPSFR